MKKYIAFIAFGCLLATMEWMHTRQIVQLKATVQQQSDFIAQQKMFNELVKSVAVQIAEGVDQVQGEVDDLKKVCQPKGAGQ